MYNLERVRDILGQYTSLEGARSFFANLGYSEMEPLPMDIGDLPEGARKVVASVHQVVHMGDVSPFRVFHVELSNTAIRRTDIRRFLDAFYRHQPQGENLFVFSPEGLYDDLAFVSPRRLPDPRDPGKVRLWLRILQVRREKPYRTDLEVLSHIQAHDIHDPHEVWRRHEEAFSVQRVTEQFFQDYSEVFYRIQACLKETHPENKPEWARDYTHQLLNRIMFIYFIARKGWLLGPDGEPDRDFMRHFWGAYRETRAKDTFHAQWLHVLFFEAFNGKWQNRAEYLKRFPGWLVKALAQAPFLNGGLYVRRHGLDDCLEHPLPDEVFEMLFEKWTDDTFPGLFERYNFTVVESGRFDEEVAVDPEMLGMVYERLVNVTFETGEEDLRGAAGIFYTPRTEIDLMCRLALVDWLSNQLEKDYKDLLYRWVFSLSEDEKNEVDEEVTKEGLWEQLDALVRRVRVCDPACGSGSFLVGMMLVLDDLQTRCGRALGQDETPYQRRKRILQDQLYGVDVMEWAVRVAELRLWLQLVVETDLHPAELHFKPLLPNLNFKLRPGDSLLQTVGDIDLSHFRRSDLSLPPYLKGRLTRLKGKKRRFFLGEDRSLSEELLKKEEQDLFRDILLHKIHELENRLKEMRRDIAFEGDLSAEDEPRQRKVRGLEEELKRLKEALSALAPDRPPPFVWDIAFVEVFEDDNPGFDIVIGNPPYVRQEKIRDYLGRFERKEYLNRINEGLRAIYPAFMGKGRKISGRADYYVYFYLHGLSLLADKGAFCFITSNSWLDVDFGKDLQEFFLRHGHLKMVIDNRAKRSFAQADVNTVIVLAGPPERKRALTEKEMKERAVRFMAFREPFEMAVSAAVFTEIEDETLYRPLAGFQVLVRPEVRSVLWDQCSLHQDGLESGEGKLEEARKYKGNKWGGKYLRAPDIFFTILEKGKGKLVRLGDIAEVRRGFTTGANEFFYLEPVGRTVKEVAELRERDPMAPVRVRNGVGWEGKIEAAWLRPVIKSPREIKTLRVRLEDLRYLVFMPPEDVREAIDKGKKPPLSRYPKAAAYIEWGEDQDYQDRPTCRSRHWWWDLGIRSLPSVVWVKSVNDNHRQAYVPFGALVDQRLYELQPNKPTDVAALLNSITFLLTKELTSRVNLGEGALDTAVYEANATFIIIPAVFSSTQCQRFLSAFDRLASRPVRSIFEELGFVLCRARRCDHPEHPYEHVQPEALTLEQVRHASPDRFELDSVVFDVLGLTEEERLEVYRAVAQLVKDRLVKARSV